MSVIIQANVMSLGVSNDPNIAVYEVQYSLSQVVNNHVDGIASVSIAVSLTDSEIEANLRDGVAAFVSAQTGELFTSSDVRGCKI